MRQFQVPLAVQEVALKNPDLQVYVVGSYALKQWAGGDWEPNDVDVLVMAGEVSVMAHNLGRKVSYFLGTDAFAGAQRALVDKGYTQSAESGSAVPLPLYPAGRYRAICRDSPEDRERSDRAPVPNYGDEHTYDLISAPVSDITSLLTDTFDLDICAIGYRVAPYDIPEAMRAVAEFFCCMKRANVDIPVDVRRMLSSYVIERAPQPKVCVEWVFGRQFNSDAALRKPGAYAILQWERSAAEGTRDTRELFRGQSRFRKYTMRGFLVAETPCRAGTDEFMGAVEDAAMHRATVKYEEEMRRLRTRRILAIRDGRNESPRLQKKTRVSPVAGSWHPVTASVTMASRPSHWGPEEHELRHMGE